jgi:ACS family hexuronate transporter-like MFS transporter
LAASENGEREGITFYRDINSEIALASTLKDKMVETESPENQSPQAGHSPIRWWICSLLVVVTALNYFDRQALPVAVVALQKDVPISDQAYGRIQFLFLFAYGLMYMGGGRIIDRLGTRWGYALMVFWWSLASALQGAVTTVLGLGIFRFALGLGEGGGFPGSSRAISEWFPVKERASAFGLVNTGSSIGAVLAPPAIAGIILFLGWRWVFFLTGLFGFIWALVWLKFYRQPVCNSLRSVGTLRLCGGSTEPLPIKAVPWSVLLGFRQVQGFMLARFLCDSAWFFYIFWLPKYLGDVRHLNIKQIGLFAWIPYAFAGAGSLFGGWLSSCLLRRGLSIDMSRKIPLAVGATVMPCSLFIAASPLGWVLIFFSIAFFGHQLFSTVAQTAVVDLFPSVAVATATGLIGGTGAFGAMIFSLVAGGVVTHYHSFGPLFVLAAVLHPLALLAVVFVVGAIAPIRLNGATS